MRTYLNPIGTKLSKMFDADVYDPRNESVRAVARGTGGAFGIAVGRYEASNTPADIIQRSWERYQDVDHLIRSRQMYEALLGAHRKSGPLRATMEPTCNGFRFFVWPLPKGRRVPVPYLSREAAEDEMEMRYSQRNDIAVGLPAKKYTKAELSDWLPPESVFRERSGRPSAASRRR